MSGNQRPRQGLARRPCPAHLPPCVTGKVTQAAPCPPARRAPLSPPGRLSGVPSGGWPRAGTGVCVAPPGAPGAQEAHGWRRPWQHREALGGAAKGTWSAEGGWGAGGGAQPTSRHRRVQRVRGPGRGRHRSQELGAQRAAHPRQLGRGRGSARGTRGSSAACRTASASLGARVPPRAPVPIGLRGLQTPAAPGHPHRRPAGCILGGPHAHAQARCLPGVTQDSGQCPAAYRRAARGPWGSRDQAPHTEGLEAAGFPSPRGRGLGRRQRGAPEAQGWPDRAPRTTSP